MGKYVIQRVLQMFVIIWIAGFIVFTLMYMMPGDPAKILLGNDATESTILAKRAELGLDASYVEQLASFMYHAFVRFDFGYSWSYGVPVMQELLVRLPRTLFIGVSAMVLNVLLGTWLGVFAATHRGKWQDSLTMVIAMVFISVPDFWLALMCVLFFSINLGWLPAYGIDGPLSYVLPILSSAVAGIAINARQGRSSMLEVIHADFISTARAKGQKESVIVRKHMLPNAMMPIITGVGGGLAMVVAGSPIMESVFSIPGVGAYLLVGINLRDRPIVLACVVFFAVFTSVAILLMDLCYAFLDPRIKAQYAAKKVG